MPEILQADFSWWMIFIVFACMGPAFRWGGRSSRRMDNPERSRKLETRFDELATELDHRAAVIEHLEGRVAELENRVDFAERMLATRRAEGLPAGQPESQIPEPSWPRA